MRQQARGVFRTAPLENEQTNILRKNSAAEDDRSNRPACIPGTPGDLNAVIAAPGHHEVILENDRVRVIRVTIPPGGEKICIPTNGRATLP